MKRFAVIAFLLAASARFVFAINLDEALATTLDKNPAIQQARAGLEQAAGQRLVLRSIGLPNARTQGAIGDQGKFNSQKTSTKVFGFSQGFFTQALFNAAVPPSGRRGDVELLIAKQKLNVAVVEQLHAARIAFYTALYNRSLLGLREAQRSALEENVSGEKARYENGTSKRGALTAAMLLTRELDPQVEDARRAYQGALVALAGTMGRDLGANAGLPEVVGELEFAPISLDLGREREAALQRRADLKLARLVTRAAGEDQRILEAAYYPALNGALSGEYIPVSGVRRGSEGTPRRSDDIISSEYRAGADYTWRVIDNGKVYGGVKRQLEIREMNALMTQKLEAGTARELERIANELRALNANQPSLESAVAASEENVSALHESLARGLSSQLEFRDAENDLLKTKSGVLTAAYRQNILRAEWDRAAGRYFQFSDDTAANVR